MEVTESFGRLIEAAMSLLMLAGGFLAALLVIGLVVSLFTGEIRRNSWPRRVKPMARYKR